MMVTGHMCDLGQDLVHCGIYIIWSLVWQTPFTDAPQVRYILLTSPPGVCSHFK